MLSIAVSILLSASAAFAQQGVTMVMNETAGGQTTQARMQLDATHMRADVRDPSGQQTLVIYDAGAQVMRIVDMRGKTYQEITQKELQGLGGAMAQMMAEMQKELAKMPPEERKMMEEMMKARGGGPGMAGMPGGGAAPARTTYKRTGASKVGQWACTTYDGFRGSEKVEEICAADRGIDLTAADFKAAQQLASFFGKMNPQQADQIAMFGTVEAQGYAGFPVRRVTFRNGKPQSTSELSELRREALPASTWAVPEGFKKESSGLPR